MTDALLAQALLAEALLALGGNVGNSRAILDRAVTKLLERGDIVLKDGTVAGGSIRIPPTR